MAESTSALIMDVEESKNRGALDREVSSRLALVESSIARLTGSVSAMVADIKTSLEAAANRATSEGISREQDSLRELVRIESEAKTRFAELQASFREKEKRELDDRNVRDRDRRLGLVGYISTVIATIGLITGGGMAWGNSLKSSIESDNAKAQQITSQMAQKSDSEMANRLTALESSARVGADNWKEALKLLDSRVETYIAGNIQNVRSIDDTLRAHASQNSISIEDRKHLNDDLNGTKNEIAQLGKDRTEQREHQAEVETQIKSMEHQMWDMTQTTDREFVQLHVVTKLPVYMVHQVYPDISNRKSFP